jgi:hypothetical protein
MNLLKKIEEFVTRGRACQQALNDMLALLDPGPEASAPEILTPPALKPARHRGGSGSALAPKNAIRSATRKKRQPARTGLAQVMRRAILTMPKQFSSAELAEKLPELDGNALAKYLYAERTSGRLRDLGRRDGKKWYERVDRTVGERYEVLRAEIEQSKPAVDD